MIDYAIDGDGIATLAWNMPERPQNVIDGESVEAFIAAIGRAVGDPAAKAILVTSAKRDFIAGSDPEWLFAAKDPERILERTLRFHRALRQLENCGKPVAAALPGSALGGGLEVALVAHYRVAAGDVRARFGFPEVTLGLMPGAGATQRLPRRIGIERALPLLLEGRRLGAAEALAAGLVDTVVAPGEERRAARAWLLGRGAGESHQPWDGEGYALPGGAMASPDVQQALMAANALLHARTFGNYPALQNILSAVYEGLVTDIDTGLVAEARYFVRTLLSPQARAMVDTLVFAVNEANRLAARPDGVPTQVYTQVGILGAGMMGSGIAFVTAKAGIAVVLLDTTMEAAERGRSHARDVARRQVERGVLAADEAEALVARIDPSTDYTRLAGTELAIEAVFEDRAVKADVTRRAEAVTDATAILASNTSTLPISGLAEASVRPANFIGLHFFSPVEKMPLVEVIVGRRTSRETVARALDFVRALGMTPIVVNDARGFYTSRVFSSYLLEGMAMVSEGVVPALVENAATMAGMPVGPLALADEVSIELIHRINGQARADLGKAYRPQPGEEVVARMVELGRVGKKAGRGFYDYPAGAAKRLWPGLAEEYPSTARQPAVGSLIERFLTVQAVEAARCLDEGVVTSARDADVGAVLGWGFPAFRGGPISHIRGVGVAAFGAQCERLAARHGQRFAPPPRLEECLR